MSTPKSTQYDAIGEAYASMKLLPGALLERESMRATLAPYIRSAKVLDLACGTGYYSRLLLTWGASSVVGVDISSAMVSAAEEASSQLPQFKDGQLKFLVGDAMKKPLPDAAVAAGPYDVVVGAWLLNYAPSTSALTDMFSNIASSLNPTGVFVGITPHPALDLDTFARLHSTDEAKHEMRHQLGVSVEYLSALDSGEGYNTRITGHTSPVEISFENFHLRRECYESAARAVGGRPEWKEIAFPSDEEERRNFGISPSGPKAAEFWNSHGFEKRPHLGILLVEMGGS